MNTAKYKTGPPWVDTFRSFYSGFPSMFERKVRTESLPLNLRPKLVKTIGDELLLVSSIENCEDAASLVQFLGEAIVDYSEKNLAEEGHDLSLKATAWIAGFPINNHRVMLPIEGGTMIEDYIGPSIDTGFRISKFATPQKLIVSVDLALLLTWANRRITLYFDGTETLKGVLGGRPYPIIWCRTPTKNTDLHDAEIVIRHLELPDGAMKRYCEAYVKQCEGTWLTRPYFETDVRFATKPQWHDSILEEWSRVDRKHADDDPSMTTEGDSAVCTDSNFARLAEIVIGEERKDAK